MLKIEKQNPEQWLSGQQVWEMLNYTVSTRFPWCVYDAGGPRDSPTGAHSTQRFVSMLAFKGFSVRDSPGTKGPGARFRKGCTSPALLLQTRCLWPAVSK